MNPEMKIRNERNMRPGAALRRLAMLRFIGNLGKTWLALVLLTAATSALALSVPPVVVSSTATVSTSGTTKVNKVVQDTCGNLYELENSGNLMEIPAGGGAAVYLVSYGGYSSDGLRGGLAIDSSNNLYVDHKWSGEVIEIPSSGCSPQVSNATSVANNNSLGSVDGYWYDPGDIAVDASGHIFVVSDGFGGSGNIYEQTSSTSGVKVFAGGSMGQISSIAVDSSGNVFFTASGSGSVYEVPVASYGTSSATTVLTGLTTALGLAFDSAGNLYVGDASTGNIYEVPYSSSALQFSSFFQLVAGAPLGAPLTIAQDGKSFFVGNDDTNLYQIALGSANFGSVSIGSSSTATIGFVFNAAETPSSFTLFPSSGQYAVSAATCSASTAYTAGQSCTETVAFTPTTPGMSKAALSAGTSSSVLGTVYLGGVGVGAGLTIDPGTTASFGSGFKAPKAVAIDAAGDVFIADSSAGKVYEYAAGSSTAVSIGSGLSAPQGVAVDGAGNVYIADTGNSRIVEVPMINGALSSSSQTALATTLASTALKSPAGVTVNAVGDLFIADTGNNRIVYVPFTTSLNTSAATALVSSLSSPLATAVDAAGDLYVANTGEGQIYKVVAPFAQGEQELVANGFGNPSGLAVDASGSLFVADSGNDELLRIPNVSGSLVTSDAVDAGLGVTAPYGVAIDAAGNLYVSDSADAAAYLVTRTSTTLGFGDWAVSATGSTLVAELENSGNATLDLSSPYYTASGATTDYTITSGGSGECAASGTVAAGASCELAATFAPTVSGTRSDVLTLASNAANASGGTVTLTGVGSTATSTATVLAMTSPSSGSPYFGEAITLTATVTATSGTPSGTVLLLVDSVQTEAVTLSSKGVATFTLSSGLSGGTHTLLAVFNGTSSFNGSVSSSLSLTVTKAATATALAVTTPYINPLSAVSGASVTLLATVGSSGTGIPTGTVTFTANGTSLGSATLAPASGGLFEASLSTTALAVGTDAIVATYSGDANYYSSVSSSTSVTVVSAAKVTATASATSLTSTANSAGTVTFTSTSYGGWNGIVGFSCDSSTLPANSRCVFSPGQAMVLASTSTTSYTLPTVQLSLVINQPPQTTTASRLCWWTGGLGGLLLLLMRKRLARRYAQVWAGVLLAVVLLPLATAGVTGCSSGNVYTTPKGTSTVTVYANADPYTVSSGTLVLTSTQTCGTNSTTGYADPSLSPCSQTKFSVAVTVQ